MKHLIHLVNNTPYDKVALKVDSMPPEDQDKLQEYKLA